MDDTTNVARNRAAKVQLQEESMSELEQDSDVSANIFDNNDAKALIDNPLLYWKPAEVEHKAERFAREFGLENQTEVFIKAAHILRDPEVWFSVRGLTAEEKEALKAERTNRFWQQPKELRITIITLCVAAVVQGWNQTASNGANLNWPNALGLTHINDCDPQGREAWIFAIVNASTYFAASLIGNWIADPLNEYFLGRRASIGISGALILAAAVGSACTRTWHQLLACRIILGIGMGCKASVVPVFAAEVAPAHLRGSLVMNWQLMDALGIFMGCTANLIVSQVGATAWRWMTASSALPTIVLLSLIFVIPDSPRFLMKHRRYHEAYRTLVALRGEPIIAAKELLYVHKQMEVELRFLSPKTSDSERNAGVTDKSSEHTEKVTPRKSINYWQKFGQLFTQRRVRRAMVASVVCMISQQLCGVNVLAFYSTTFFCAAHNQKAGDAEQQSNLQPLFLSWGIFLCNFLFALPAYWLIDRCGRRWLLLVTLPFLALTMLAAGLSFKIPSANEAHAPVIAFWTYVFMVFYSPGMGPVPFTMSAEVFPLESRVVGMSFAVFVNLFGAGLLTLFVPALTLAIGHSGLLGIFAGLNVVAFICVFFFVRETAGAAVGGSGMTFMSLEELNYIFGVSTRKHASYQVGVVVPWAWNYFVRRRKDCDKDPKQLYAWAVEEKRKEKLGNEVVEDKQS